jgi:hypothetical protein
MGLKLQHRILRVCLRHSVQSGLARVDWNVGADIGLSRSDARSVSVLPLLI